MSGFYSNDEFNYRDIKTGTKVDLDKVGVIRQIENLLNEKPGSENEQEGLVYQLYNVQNKKGI